MRRFGAGAQATSLGAQVTGRAPVACSYADIEACSDNVDPPSASWPGLSHRRYHKPVRAESRLFLCLSSVWAGLAPAIHVLTHDTAYLAELRALTRRSSLQRCTHRCKDCHGRDKPGHDAEGGRALFSYVSAYGACPAIHV